MTNHLSFEAKDKKLKEILFGNLNSYYKIPRYQRPYAWNEEQISEYWNDLLTENQTYFLGSFIFNTQYEDQGYIEVIDGQQRLLTTTIFIAVLRDICKELNEKKTSDLFQRQNIAFEDEDGNETYRIMPGDSTKPFFEKYIQRGIDDIKQIKVKNKEEQRIQKNYVDLYNRVSRLIGQIDSKEQKLEKIKNLRKKSGNLIVIDIKLKSEDVAYEIFETVNARGVELSVSDLLKNLIFSKIKGTEGKDIAKEMWSEIENNISQTGVDLKKFIRYYWISKYSFVTEKKLYSSIKTEITNWQSFIDSLYEASNWYTAMHVGNVDDFKNVKSSQKIFRSIFAIRLMNVSQCHVLFLSLLQNFKKVKMDIYKTFELIEKFTYQYSAICKMPGNRVEKIYSKFARNIYKAIENSENEKQVRQNVQTELEKLKSELKSELPSRELFLENYKELSYGRSEKARQLIKYSFEEINNYKATGEHKIDFSKVNIEHILPQEPTKWGLTKNEIKHYVNKIGNLTLLSHKINSKIGNDVISRKLLELKKSEIGITSELVAIIESQNDWNEEMIYERQYKLAEKSFDEIWKIK